MLRDFGFVTVVDLSVALAGVMVLFSVAVFVWLLGLPIPLWREW
jgi:hypothetical protein